MTNARPMRDALVPAWETIARDFVETGIPCSILVREAPHVSIFVDEGAARLGGSFEAGANAPAPPADLAHLSTAFVAVDGRRRIEVATASPELFRNLFFMLADVASGVVVDGQEPGLALSESLRRWAALLAHGGGLSEERQVGLFGELWVLARLAARLGAPAIDAWTGPRRAAHDFRLAAFELEVKTTARPTRVHTINGLHQLVPSPGFELHLLSLQLADGGAGGTTLGEAARSVGALFGSRGPERRAFDEAMLLCGYVAADERRYTRRRKLAAPPVLLRVSDGCPRLVPDALLALPASHMPERIGKVAYDVDLTGLGSSDGSPEFLAVLPAAAPGREVPFP